MPKMYVTFGRVHKHVIENNILDVECVAVINVTCYPEGIQKVKKLFGQDYNMYYFDKDFPLSTLKYYSRGFIKLSV